MDKFTRTARKSTKIGLNPSKITQVSRQLKSSVPGNLRSSLGAVDIRRSVRFGEATFGNAPMRRVVPQFRRGNLNNAMSLSNTNRRVSGAVESNTKALFRRRYPDVELDALRNRKARLAIGNTDLNRPLRSTADFDALTPAAKSKVNRVWAALTSKKTAFVAGAFTKLALLGGGAALLLSRAAEARNGCWAIVNNNGKNVYCKLVRRSCGSQAGGTPCDTTIDSRTAGNLYYMVLLAKNKSALRQDIEAATGSAIDYENFDKYINDNAEALSEFYGNLDASKVDTSGNLCLDSAGKAITDGCVMCDPEAEPLSRNYVDSSELEENITYQCIQNSSVLDVLNDLGDNVVNLGGKALSNFTDIFKYLWIIVGVIGVVIASILALRFLPARRPAQYIPAQPPLVASAIAA